jgi:tetratricopeptide (TPR) repeat protein
MLFVFMAKRKPILIAGWLFFLISLLPVIGLLQVGLQGYADRYVYFPYWGLFIIIVFGLDFKEWFSQKPFFKYASIVFGLIVAVFLFFISREQMKTWNNDEALFQNVMKVSPNAFIAPFQLGFVQKSKGNFEKAKPYYQKALEIAEEDIRLKPKSGRAYHNKGNALLMLEKYDEAIECFVKAKEYGFDAKDINEKIEIAKKFILKQIVSEGKKLGEENRWNEAEMKFREAVKIDPNSAELWSYLGYILDQKNDLDEAQKAFEKALEINPLYDTAIYNLSIVELKKNKLDKIDQRLSLLEKLHSPYAQQLKSLLSE